MTFKKSVEFKGGFAFLGPAETIKYVAGNISARAALSFFSYGGSWAGTTAQVNALTYSTNTTTNVNSFLSSLRTATGYTGAFSAFTFASVIVIDSRATDAFTLSDCIFGPGLPSHKDTLGGDRHPYINIKSSTKIALSNIYLRGNTTITSAGIGLPGTSATTIENSNILHYGSSVVTGPYTYRQFYHTFIGTLLDSGGGLSSHVNFSRIGNYYSVRTGEVAAGGGDYNFYSDQTGKPLPNHIHLLTNASTSSTLVYASNNDDGPFLDQFIHAKNAIAIEAAFFDALANSTTLPVRSGFLGRFGSNGHNSTKTRGILLGCNYLGPEGGTILLTELSGTGTIFKRAGAINTTALPYVPNPGTTTDYGEGFPVGSNPVITAADNGSTTLLLNMGGRSWRAGISPQRGSAIKPDRSANIAI
jgi:hypothetical protein